MTSKYHQQAKARKKKRKKSFPDLNKDGKLTFADVLKGKLRKGRK